MAVIGQHLDPARKAELLRRLQEPGAVPTHIAREMGVSPCTAQKYARELQASVVPFSKPKYRVPYLRGMAAEPANDAKWQDDRIYRVLAIGDHHDKPGRDKTRALWIGRHAAETRPDAIVSIGDWASLDSLSTHEMPGSQNDAERSPFHLELESLNESLSMFHFGIPIGEIPVFHTHGNHEHRAVRAANKQPKLNGDMPVRLDQVFAQHRWKVLPFGEALDLYGVDFVHCYLNKMGREVGGDNLNLIANKCSRSIVFGHTHVNGVFNQAKYGHDFGKSRKITVVNLGTSMPYGMVEKYSGLSTTGWGYGIYDLRIQNGVILTAKPMDMLELEEKYA